jgi:hypothetical protein
MSSQNNELEISFFNSRELELLKEAEDTGSKPISATLAAQMYHLFLDGYDCKEIARINPAFTEKDILVCRNRNNWDEDAREYTKNLSKQIEERLLKNRLESIEYITNHMSVVHKDFRDKTLKFLQTGKEEDKPEVWAKSPMGYKSLLETLQKLTGEDRTTKTKIENKNSQDINVTITNTTQDLSSDDAAKILSVIAEAKRNKGK